MKSKNIGKIFGFLILIAASTIVVVVLVIFLRNKDDDHVGNNTNKNNKITLDIGVLRGTKDTVLTANTRKNVSIYSFKGIPYAVPPIGKLRFRNPVPLNSSTAWKGVFNATTFGEQCFQIFPGPVGAEDCLYLNVFTPTLNKKANLPVFVWIHGGFLLQGFGHFPGYHPDEEFTASMNVVSVTMNYRLNAIGFLSLKEIWEKGESYGNYGIQDQILALRWVKENIKNFGGNPNVVTLAGESSGGSSVYGIVSSPIADGLFHRAIIMSAPPLYRTTHIQADIQNRGILNFTRCKNVAGKDLKNCLLNISPLELVSAAFRNQNPLLTRTIAFDIPTLGIFFGSNLMVLDPTLFINAPENIRNTSFPTQSKVPVLLGTLAQEIGLNPTKRYYNQSLKVFENDTRPKLNRFSPDFYNKIVNNLYANLTLPNKTRDESTQFIYETIASDIRVTCPNMKRARLMNLSPKHKVYHYVISNRLSNPIIAGDRIIQHAVHTWDTIALFDFKDPDARGYIPTERDRVYQQTLRRNIKAFIVNGKPMNPTWTTEKTAIFNQNGAVDILDGDYEKERCDFWNNPKNGFTDYAWTN